MTRVFDHPNLAGLRLGYLFPLAHVCHMSPAAVDAGRLMDFARLIRGIDEWAEANQPKPG